MLLSKAAPTAILTPPGTTPAQPPSPTSIPTLQPTSPMPLEEALSSSGPWIIFFSGEGTWADGIWALNRDGSGLVRLVEDLVLMPHDLKASISPIGGHLAFITAADRQYRSLELKLMKMPEGQITSITRLSSPAIEPKSESEATQNLPAPLAAITQKPSLAWSPDGRQLALVGALETDSSDLYLYSVEDGQITHLTIETHQAVQPSWSPDGKYLLYFEVDEHILTAYIVNTENGEAAKLYGPLPSGNEVLLGWNSEDSFSVCSLTAGGSHHDQGEKRNLRQVDIRTRTEKLLWEASFSDAALEPGSSNAILLLAESSGLPGGIYHLDTTSGTSWRIVEDRAFDVVWSEEAGLFFVMGENGILAISPWGDFVDLDVPETASGYPVFASEARTLLWKGAGLWIGSLSSSIDNPPQQVYDKPVEAAAITPDAEVIFFFGEEGLFTAHAPEYRAILLQAGLAGDPFGWVWP